MDRPASDRHHLLVRRNLTDPTDVAFFYCYVPAGQPASRPHYPSWSPSPDADGLWRKSLESRMRGNPHVRFGGRPHGKGPAPRAPRRAAHPSQVGKDQFGLDHSQVRLYTALLRHLMLAMLALAACAVTTAAMRALTNTAAPPPTHPDDEPPDDPGLIPLTVAEVKRLANLLTATGQRLAHHLRWSWWRRRHQARARWFHHRDRLRRNLQTTHT